MKPRVLALFASTLAGRIFDEVDDFVEQIRKHIMVDYNKIVDPNRDIDVYYYSNKKFESMDELEKYFTI